MHDLVIENARIVDGTGAASFHGSLAVDDGRIVSISREARPGERAQERIDAEGRAVAPGFVDPHTHYDAQVAWDPLLTCSPWHGVTSVMMGNCGVGVAPVRADAREIAMWDLVNVEAIPFDVMERALEWGWEGYPDYLDALDARGLGVNVAAMVPLTPLRQFVLGEAAFDRAANEEERAEMARLLREAMDAGAFGFSTTLLNNHVGYGGRPIACRQADDAELGALCDVLRDAGRGAIEAAVAQTDVSTLSDEELHVLRLFAERSGRPVTYLALINRPEDPKSYLNVLELLGDLLDIRRVVPQIACRPLKQQFDMSNPFLLGALTAFRPIFNKTREEQAQLYGDADFRRAVKEELPQRLIMEDMVGRIRLIDASSEAGQAQVASGRTMAEVGAKDGRSAIDVLLDLAAVDPDLMIDVDVANFEPEGTRNLIQDGRFLIGLGDGGAHVAQLCDACYPTYLLGRWVREQQAISLEEGVRQLTSVPADFFGIADRGRLAEGLAADLVLFDPDTVDTHEPEFVDDLPGGARRMVARAEGIHGTFVNGRALMQDGEHVGELPGRVLRSA
jgi:N-acyl-D-aspartate/D-glutamate deacylase